MLQIIWDWREYALRCLPVFQGRVILAVLSMQTPHLSDKILQAGHELQTGGNTTANKYVSDMIDK